MNNHFVDVSKIKNKRLEVGLSRSEMSRRFGIPVRTLENWEAGINQPPEYVERLLLESLDRIKEDVQKEQ